MNKSTMNPQELIAALNRRREAIERLWYASGLKPQAAAYTVLHQAYAAASSRYFRAVIEFDPVLHPGGMTIAERVAAAWRTPSTPR